MMKSVLAAAAFCLLSNSSALAADGCATVPASVGGLIQTNPDASVTILFPTLNVAGQKFGLVMSQNTAAGLCKLMDRSLIKYSHNNEATKLGKTLVNVSSEGSVEGVSKISLDARFYQIASIICK